MSYPPLNLPQLYYYLLPLVNNILLLRVGLIGSSEGIEQSLTWPSELLSLITYVATLKLPTLPFKIWTLKVDLDLWCPYTVNPQLNVLHVHWFISYENGTK